jgi:hypothetical protein
MKQKSHQHNSNMSFPGEQPPDLPPLDPNESAFWNEQPSIRNLNGSNPLGNPESSIDDANVNVPCLVPNSPNNSGTIWISIVVENYCKKSYFQINFFLDNIIQVYYAY